MGQVGILRDGLPRDFLQGVLIGWTGHCTILRDRLGRVNFGCTWLRATSLLDGIRCRRDGFGVWLSNGLLRLFFCFDRDLLRLFSRFKAYILRGRTQNFNTVLASELRQDARQDQYSIFICEVLQELFKLLKKV